MMFTFYVKQKAYPFPSRLNDQTNVPGTTQLMMVAAFGGYETVMNAYKVAKEEGYRFGTYGDAMLIL